MTEVNVISNIDDNKVLSAAQKRELRKQRLLAGSEKRMSAILNVGGERRQAPCIDGASTITSSQLQTSSVELQLPKTEVSKNSKTLDFFENDLTPEVKPLDETSLNRLVTPKHINYVNRSRFWIAISLSLVFALWTSCCTQISNVLLPLLLIICSYETLAFKTKKLLRYQSADLATVASGLNKDPFLTFGILVETLWEVGMDVLLMAFGFITFKLIIDFIQRAFAFYL